MKTEMRQSTLRGTLLVFSMLLIYGCSNTSPEKNFSIAVLNSNLLSGFAGNGLSRELESPSVKLSESGNETLPMKRTEIIENKIRNIEESYEKVKDLNVTDDTKDIVSSSMALYEYVLPVYKTEYMQLAELYDSEAPQDKIKSQTELIHDKYFPRFKELYDKLIGAGKVYAAKHNIKVNWQDK